MIDCGSFILRSVMPSDYNFILSWYRSVSAISGFVNPGFEFYDLEKIREMYDEEHPELFTFMVQSRKNLPLGMVMVNVEWKNRNAVIDIIMGGSSSGMSLGSKALQAVTLYCKNELNLRRIEIKISEKNKTMMKLFRFLPGDEQDIINVFIGENDYDPAIREYYKLTPDEYEAKKVWYQIQYIKHVLYKEPAHELTLYDESVLNGSLVSFHVSSFSLSRSTEDIEDIFLLVSGDLTKSRYYKEDQLMHGQENG